MKEYCPCCGGNSELYKVINGYNYFVCSKCTTIFIENKILERMDAGGSLVSLVEYDENYWASELLSSKTRSYGVALARIAEAIYYSRIPIKKFIDIGTGPGYTLDALSKYLPNKKDVFYGVEKYPPKEKYRTKSDHYVLTDYDTLPFKVDGGVCIEVIEHLTPTMFKSILKKIAVVSSDGALFIFNTGMPAYVMHEDANYLDPTRRGHIVSYSLKGVESIVKDIGFTALEIKGKTWAFALEYKSKSPKGEKIQDRIWSALKENLAILEDEEMGSALKILGLETARAYGA